ncbi:MAG: acyltransferase [Acidothermaceae bacterium]
MTSTSTRRAVDAAEGDTAAGASSVATASTASRPGGERSQGSAEKRVWSIDLVRLTVVFGVVCVHCMSFLAPPGSVTAGAATIVLHVNREVFIFITACVLCYVYAQRVAKAAAEGRRRWPIGDYWLRRYRLVLAPYLTWTAIYFFANSGPNSWSTFWYDVETGNARFHLYFLLVTMQIYLVLPLLLPLLRITAGHHGLLVAAGLAVQFWFTAIAHYAPSQQGLIGVWLRNDNELLFSYVGYVVLGAVIATHLREWHAWLRGHNRIVLGVAAFGLVAGLTSYFCDVEVRGQSPFAASAVLQPAVTIEAIALIVGLFALGAWWAPWRAPSGDVVAAGAVASEPISARRRKQRRFVAAGSDASFGIYLVHPLLLQGGMILANEVGWLYAARNGSGPLVAVLVIVVVVPILWLASWALTSFFRGTPLSLPLTGRPARKPAGAWLPAQLSRPRATEPSTGPSTERPTERHLSNPELRPRR